MISRLAGFWPRIYGASRRAFDGGRPEKFKMDLPFNLAFERVSSIRQGKFRSQLTHTLEQISGSVKHTIKNSWLWGIVIKAVGQKLNGALHAIRPPIKCDSREKPLTAIVVLLSAPQHYFGKNSWRKRDLYRKITPINQKSV